ncbi:MULTISPECIES: DUF3592 domain-containing protein [Acidovorax]|uniref:DUF3592 domain-containing protein n=1 Tax=Acidovorax facilis TaxID=12917 RepID=A0ABV8DDR8_9BURK|nr:MULTISPECIES: DUF3592 domain-containing protein [Acidovorax]MBO1011293.1 DUF3592 domain-containing protein [Acidovorax sp. SD340]MCO4243354.1 DUF3592 domain-containing protein [Acidovorax facilis]
MSPASPRRATQRREKLPGGIWVLALFAVPFAAAGIGIFWFMVASPVFDWARMQTWNQVPAVLESATLQSHHPSKGGTTHSVSVRYRYVVEGVAYTGQRAAIHERADNIGSFQEELGRRLQGLQRTGKAVPVWVNPRNPAESIVDRRLRPGLITLALVLSSVSAWFGLAVLAKIARAVWNGGTPVLPGS